MSNENIDLTEGKVVVDIYDSVIGGWIVADYAETDSAKATYLRNRDLIQPKLTPTELDLSTLSSPFTNLPISLIAGTALGNSNLVLSVVLSQNTGQESAYLELGKLTDILPLLPFRAGQVWDVTANKFVGSCLFKSDGILLLDLYAELLQGVEYAIIV